MSWTDLPKKFMQNVVGRLDLMSRHSLRCSSRLNRSIVDSTENRIPRVKFSMADSKYTILIFTGIEKWVNIQVSKGKDKGTVVYSQVMSPDPVKTIHNVSPLTPCDLAMSIMATLLSHDNIIIGVLEWDICGGLADPYDETTLKRHTAVNTVLTDKLKQLTGKSKVFRVKKTHTTSAVVDVCDKLLAICSDVECTEAIAGHAVVDPVAAYDRYDPDGSPNHAVSRFRLPHPELLDKLYAIAPNQSGIMTFRFRVYDGWADTYWESCKDEITVTENAYVKCEIKDIPGGQKIFVAHSLSECGYCVHIVNPESLKRLGEGYVTAYVTAPICRMGYFCKKCCDPFEYWYHQNIKNWMSFVTPLISKELVKELTPAAEAFDKVTKLSEASKSLYLKIDKIVEDAKDIPNDKKDQEYREAMKQVLELSGNLKKLAGAADTVIESVGEEAREVIEMVVKQIEPDKNLEEGSEMVQEREPKVVEIDEEDEVPVEKSKISKDQKPKVSDPQMVPKKIEPTKMVAKEPESDVYAKIAQKMFSGVRNRRVSASEDYDEFNLDASVDYVCTAGPGQFDEYMERRRIMDNEGNEPNLARWLALAGFMIYFSGALYVLFYVVLWFA